MESDCSQMQILGMEQAVPLEKIYTEVRFVARVKARMYKTILELEQETRLEVERRSLESIRKRTAERLAEEAKANRARDVLHAIDERHQKDLASLESRTKATLAKTNLCGLISTDQPLAQVLNKIRALYEESVVALKACGSTQDERDIHTKARESLNKRYRGKKEEEKREFEFELERLRRQHQERTLKIKKERKRAQARLSELEIPYRQIVEDYELRVGALRKQTKATMARVTQESRAAALTEEEQKEILDKLEALVEQELEHLTQRELAEKVMNDFGHSSAEDEKVLSAWQAVNSKPCSLVLGKPGAGKTTFLKHVVLKNLRAVGGDGKLPIFVALREFCVSPFSDLFEFIADELGLCGFPSAQDFLGYVLRGKEYCVLLFDGLDEVPQDDQAKVVGQIVRLSHRFRRNQYVVSCRTANYRGQLEGFTEFEVMEFGSAQVADFTRGWFGADKQLARSFMVELKRHPGLQELTTTPLLLALLCIGYARNRGFPGQKSLVYLASLDALLVDWDSSKRVGRDSFVARFDPETKKQLLGKVACDAFCEEKIFFLEQELIDRLETNTRRLPVQDGMGAEILREYVENHGLLVERAKSIFSFSHLTVQEFLAAFYLSRSPQATVLETLADQAWQDRRWREVVVFLGGLLPQADTFLVCLRNRLKAGLREKRFRDMLLSKELPNTVKFYVREHAKGISEKGWEAWFRWRIFEYRLHEASYGKDCSELVARVPMFGTDKLIAGAFGLGRDLSRDLALDRPLNRALRRSVEELPRSRKEWDLRDEIDEVGRYLATASMIAEILGPGARVSPSLRERILVDIGKQSFEVWDYPSAPNPNLLGV